jgi:hypothetical protein
MLTTLPIRSVTRKERVKKRRGKVLERQTEGEKEREK